MSEPAPATPPGEPAAPPAPDLPAAAGGALCGVHPEVAAITTCVRCGTFACAECAHPMPDGRAFCKSCYLRGAAAVPWEQRKQIGYWRSFWRTSWQVCFSPTRFFRTPPFETGIVPPFFYNTAAQAVGVIGMYLWIGITYAVLGIIITISGAGNARGEGTVLIGAGLAMSLGGGLCGVAMSPLNAIYSLALGGGLAHLGMMAVRARKVGIEGTVRAIAYSQAPMIFYLVPVLGWVVGPIWTFVVSVIALRETHQTSTWRALLGMLLLPTLLGLLTGVGLMFVYLLLPALRAAG